MKTILTLVLVIIFTAGQLKGQTSGNSVSDVILNGYSVQKYTTEPVTDQQLDLILKCGIKAPSANNRQPWKFTVIKDETTIKEIIKDGVAGNVLIIVSGVETLPAGTTPDFDCGLASQTMYIAAEGLGLGARMYSSPARNINLRREELQIPAGYKAVVVLRIGNTDKTVDAVSAASTRKMPEEIINYKK